MTRRRSGKIYLVGVLLVLLVSFVLRVYRLDAQSLWYDEGNSAVMAGRSLQQIFVNSAADIHPPLYYVLLHGWTGIAGTSEFALRYLSLVFGVLSVAFLVIIARLLMDRTVAVVAGVLAGVSPFLIYYAQEARMYAQLCAFATLSTYFFFKLISTPASGGEGDERPGARTLHRRLFLGGYVLATAAAVYTQYFAFAVLFTQVTVQAILVLRRSERRPLISLMAAQVAVALLYLPWAPALWHQFSTWSTSAKPTTLVELVHNVLLVFGFGLSWDATATEKSEVLIALILLLGIVAEVIRTRDRANNPLGRTPSAALFFVIPLLVMVGLELRRPTYQPKLLIPAAIAYDLLLAMGVVGISRWGAAATSWFASRHSTGMGTSSARGGTQGGFRIRRRTASLAAIVIVLLALVSFFDARSLKAYYFDPKYQRDDYRTVARFIQSRAQNGDAIVLNAPNQIEILDYYYRGPLVQYPLPRQRPLDAEATAGDLADVIADHARIWVVEWAVRESDPDGFIRDWLSRHCESYDMGLFGQVKLTLYTVARHGSGPDKSLQQ